MERQIIPFDVAQPPRRRYQIQEAAVSRLQQRPTCIAVRIIELNDEIDENEVLYLKSNPEDEVN